MDKLNALFAAVALVILVSIWIRTSLMLARLRSLARALAGIANGLRPLTEWPDTATPGDLENAQRALMEAQEILADAIGGSDGHEIEVRANLNPSIRYSTAQTVERRVSAIRNGADPLPDRYRSARL